ncbi:MAG: hypothetical protein OXN86_03100 [Chloroflexota bacterium]|nr:hypothetical protein [Chloroflexota bacterium]MDE2891481.1 hypothetical protein [Chloroflexota bacterium]
MDAGEGVEYVRSVAALCRLLRELITEQAKADEGRVHGAPTELVDE